MKFKRNMKLDMEWVLELISLGDFKFKIGDAFIFKMKDGERVKVRAVKEDANGNMLFIFEDCLKCKYTMNQILNEGVLKRIYNMIPKKVRKLLVAFDDKDYLRLPTEKEIFGVNECGEEEGDDVQQFSIMKQRRNRIAFRGYVDDELEWYWLKNKKHNSDGNFAIVNYGGGCYYYSASVYGGVRPLLCIKNI